MLNLFYLAEDKPEDYEYFERRSRNKQQPQIIYVRGEQAEQNI